MIRPLVWNSRIRASVPHAVTAVELRAIRGTTVLVFSPVRRARGLKRAQRASDQPLSRLVEADTLGFPWLRTRACQRSTRCHSGSRTSDCMVGVGLPQLRGRMGNAKSYAERLFDFPKLGPLYRDDARSALEMPVVNE